MSSSRRSRRHRCRPGFKSIDSLFCELLESKQLLAADVSVQFSDLVLDTTESTTVAIEGKFEDTAVSGTVIKFETNAPLAGNDFYVELTDNTPLTNANFLSYVNSGAYDNSIFNRSVSNFILQGGGFKAPTVAADQPESIPTPGAIQNEPGNPNIRGTIAMAKSAGQTDGATSQFFFNLDTNLFLDSDNGGYTVFGEVLGSGMTVVDTMSSTVIYNASTYYSNTALPTLPLWNINQDNIIRPNDFVKIENADVVTESALFTYQVSSSDSAKLTASFDGNRNLVLTPVGGATGSIDITVTATSKLDDSTASDTFSVQLDEPPPVLTVIEASGNIALNRDASGALYANDAAIIRDGQHVSVDSPLFDAYSPVAAESDAGTNVLLLDTDSSSQVWEFDPSWNFTGTRGVFSDSTIASYDMETLFDYDINGDGTVGPVNGLPTGSVTISGVATEGEVLTADTSTLADEDGVGLLSYQWSRDAIYVDGATSSTYTLTQGDVGAHISVRIDYTDNAGTAESLTSVQTSVVLKSLLEAPDYLVTSFLNTIDEFESHFSRQDTRVEIFYDESTTSLRLTGPHELGIFDANERWTEFAFEIKATQLSFGNLDLLMGQGWSTGYYDANRHGIKLTDHFQTSDQWQSVQISYDEATRTLTAYVGGIQVTQASVFEANWNRHFSCMFRSGDGQEARVEIRNARIGRPVIDTTKPQSFFQSAPSIRTTPLANSRLIFSEPVTGLQPSHISLSRDGESINISSLSITGGPANYLLSGLEHVTGSVGTYELRFQNIDNQVRDSAGNIADDSIALTWEVSPFSVSEQTHVLANYQSFWTYYRQSDDRGEFFYDPENNTLVEDGPYELANFSVPQRWNDFSFVVDVEELSFSNFFLRLSDGNNPYTINLSDSIHAGSTYQVRITYDENTKVLRGYVNDELARETTVLDTNWNTRFNMMINQYSGGQNNILTFSDMIVAYNLSNDEPTLDALSDININEDDPEQVINLTGISAGIGETQPLSITAVSDNADLIPYPTISYTSPNSTGSLFFSTASDQSGTATITVTVEDGGLDNNLVTPEDNGIINRTVVVRAEAVNDDPTLDALSDVNINEDASEQTVNLTGITAGGGETQVLLVTAVSDNTGLIPDPTVDFDGQSSTGILKFTPVADQFGTATITVTVEDGGLDNNLATPEDNGVINRTVTVMAEAVNDEPTLDALNDININEDDPEQTVNLTGIAAGGGEAQELSVTAVSDNTGLIPDPTVTYSSAEATGTLTFTPVADQFGTATITVTVEDGGLDNDLGTPEDNGSILRTVIVKVDPVNDVPTLDVLSEVEILEDATEQTVSLTGMTAGGGDNQPLSITAVSDNTGLIPDPTVYFDGQSSIGSLRFTPVADQSGTATITVTVEDGGLDNDLGTPEDNGSILRTVIVKVDPVNDVPTLDALSEVEILEDAPEQTVSLTGITAGGGENQLLSITAVSDNTGLIPDPTVYFDGQSSIGSLSFTPVADQSGTATITVTVEDGGLDNDLATTEDNGVINRTVVVKAEAVNDEPTLDVLSEININEDDLEQTVNLTGITAGGGESQQLEVTAVSDNTGLIPDPTVDFDGQSSTATLKFTPVADQSGTATITVTVEDGGLDNDLGTPEDNGFINRTVTVITEAVNDEPTLDALSDVNINEDDSEQTVNLTGIAAGGGETQVLSVKAISDNTGLIHEPTVDFDGQSSTGTLKFTPVADQSGTATITVTVEDGGLDNNLATSEDNGVINRTVTVITEAVNDEPTLDALSDVNINEDDLELTVNLTGITAGGSETQLLSITAVSDNTGLIPDPTVDFDGQSSTGTLKVTPASDQFGTATITVTVTDGGLDDDLGTPEDNGVINRTVFIAVAPTNDVPALDELSDVTITEDAPEQTVNLTGITAGGGEVQQLRVTATSDNTGLIPDPTVTYSSDDSTGTLKFTPVADQFGTATITVTVEDGGLDNDLATTEDNGTIQRTVIVAVAPVNDTPTLDPVADLVLPENSLTQVLDITGITAGGGENQPIQVTTSNSGASLFLDPTLTTRSALGVETRLLTVTPLLDQYGIATITVTVEDGGLDLDLNTAEDNAIFSQTFDVTITPDTDNPPSPVTPHGRMFIHETLSGDSLVSYQLPAVNVNGEVINGLFNRITATSSDTALIPDPTVLYASADVPSSLSFTPVANANGTATLSIQVEDGGPDNDFATTEDNRQATHQVEVNVLEVISNQGSATLAKDGSENLYANTEPVTYQEQQAQTNIAGFAAIGATSEGGANALLVQRSSVTNRLVTDDTWRINGLFDSLRNESSPVLDLSAREVSSTLNVVAISGAYEVNGVNNPTLIVRRGQTYTLNLNVAGHPFYLQTTGSGYQSANIYSGGFAGNGQTSGEHEWVVPEDAPDEIFYQCELHPVMFGKIIVID